MVKIFGFLCKLLGVLPGYNHNLNIEGTVFHVQTEDRGSSSALIETQVFINGAIIYVEKVSYDNLAQQKNSEQKIVELMKTQHKSVLKKLADKSIEAMQSYMK